MCLICVKLILKGHKKSNKNRETRYVEKVDNILSIIILSSRESLTQGGAVSLGVELMLYTAAFHFIFRTI